MGVSVGWPHTPYSGQRCQVPAALGFPGAQTHTYLSPSPDTRPCAPLHLLHFSQQLSTPQILPQPPELGAPFPLDFRAPHVPCLSRQDAHTPVCPHLHSPQRIEGRCWGALTRTPGSEGAAS
ncbi:unnamed protein product, partial [Gulo gulo]